MPPNPLDILKKGLAKLTASVGTRWDALKAKLAKREPISTSDKLWLDNEANMVDEERVLEALESASDYEQGILKLEDTGKAIMRKLRELADQGFKKYDNY
ncbi:hypothetical protein K443DRAFT_9677 [Laccaria amethystina LaAM-08-1]|uniref:Tubulin-specific chaperone A n=1 Tax=Laccaria amethystina LaAM-08-1 TaxID=1095629 RepID=A0A0C9WM14_9AGAR|nr:hypothetical protein K443DRAFT_9677 [Laccaria amethystina LaAM-08-1]